MNPFKTLIATPILALTLVAAATGNQAHADTANTPTLTPPTSQSTASDIADTELAYMPQYVWSYSRAGLTGAIHMARANGFAPVGRPMCRYVPEAGGIAWMIYIRPCY